jgi:hypothetical protein
MPNALGDDEIRRKGGAPGAGRAQQKCAKKMAGSTRCSIQVLPEFGPKPELQDHKKENSVRSLRARPYRHLTSTHPST